jgi:hypothetical protein
MKKILYKTSFSFIFLGMFGNFAFSQSSTTCTTLGGAINDANACYTNATSMSFPVTRVLLCRTKPTAPTLSSPIGNLTAPNCVTFYSNSASADVSAQKGTTSIPNGVIPQAQFLQNAGVTGNANVTVTGGQNQNGNSVQFTYAYIETDPYISVTARANFTSTKSAVDSSTGTTCWSTSATIYSFGPVPSSGSSCGASASANPAATKVMMNSLGTGAAFMSFSSTSNGITTDTYLVDSSYRLSANTTSGNMGTVSKVVNIQNLNVTFNAQSGGVNALINITEGAWIIQNGGSPNLWFQNGNANLLLSARQGN